MPTKKNPHVKKTQGKTIKLVYSLATKPLLPHIPLAETKVLPASIERNDENKVFRRYSFDDNGGGYQGL